MQPITYMTSLLTFYMKGEIKSEQNFISFKVPNTVLGLIPLGAHTDNIPVNQIASTTTNSRLLLKPLILGIVVAYLGLAMLREDFLLALILLLIAANFIIDAFEYNLVVTTTGGQQKLIDFLIFDKSKAVLAAQQINAMISHRMDNTSFSYQRRY